MSVSNPLQSSLRQGVCLAMVVIVGIPEFLKVCVSSGSAPENRFFSGPSVSPVDMLPRLTQNLTDFSDFSPDFLCIKFTPLCLMLILFP